ncbi:DinB family protein [Streptomyces sp. NPDC048275]|uniref:DinB family protein n=1 Tax=Streptomyces sp. NPDC048275 TaxID=3155629 RepID=UPI0033C3D098
MSDDTMTTVLREPPIDGSEIDTLLGALERQRRTLAWKCGELDAAGLGARLGPSSVTLGGLLKHLAQVEDEMFQVRLHGREPSAPWDAVDFEADPDWDWRSAADDSPEQLRALWGESVARSRAAVAEALTTGGTERPAHFTTADGRSPTLRYLLVVMIEEYARHVGHADLLREAIDGLVGEDPPQ